MEIRRHVWMTVALVFAVLLVGGLVAFGANVYRYYRMIKTGQTDAIINERVQASFTKQVANRKVRPEDLARLSAPGAPTLGNPQAKLVIVEFVDFDCPFCQKTFVPLRQAVDRHKNEVYLVMRDFPIEELHPRALAAAQAARCAHAQGKYWPYHDKLFSFQEKRSDEDFFRFSEELGLNQAAFQHCYGTQEHLLPIQQDLADGLRVGVQGTPTFFFNGIKIPGALDEKALEYLLTSFLKSVGR